MTDNNTLRFSFDSASELVRSVRATPFAFKQNQENNETRNLQRGWICADRPHVVNLESALEQLERRPMFDAGVNRVMSVYNRLEVPTPVCVRRVPVRADAGDELDMGRVWNGDLEHAWRAMRRAPSVGPQRVLIAMNALTSADMSANVLALRGVAALALALALREAGHVVQISAFVDTSIRNARSTRYVAETVILGCGDEIDVHKLASFIASGLLLRGIVLPHIWRVSPTAVGWGTSNGVSPLKPDTYSGAGFDYVAVCEQNDITNERQLSDWIARQIAAIDARNGELAA